MAYVPKVWVDGVSRVDADALNDIERGIDVAHDLAEAARAVADGKYSVPGGNVDPEIPEADLALAVRNKLNALGAGGPASVGWAGVNTQTVPYTIQATDAGKLIRMDLAAAGTLSLPSDAEAAIPIGAQIGFTQSGAGQISVVSSSGAIGAPGVRTSTAYVNNSTSALKYDVPMPGGIQDTDTVAVIFELATTNAAVTWPTMPPGFAVYDLGIGPSGAGLWVLLDTNVLASEYPADGIKSFTHGHTGTPVAGVVLVLSDADLVAPFHATVGTPAYGSSTGSTGTTPSMTTAVAGALEIAIKGSSTGATVTSPSDPSTKASESITALQKVATNNSTANSQVTVSHGALGGLPNGTVVGGRGHTKPLNPDGTTQSQYGGARTIVAAPKSGQSVRIDVASAGTKTAAQHAEGVATKVAANRWLVNGFLTA